MATTGARSHDRVLAALALVCIGLQFPGTLALSTAALVVWVAACAGFDRAVLHRMWMPRFWAVTAALALCTGFLLGRTDADLWGIPISTEGFEAGSLMIVRAGLILGLTTWAGRALTEYRLQRGLGALGLAPLGRAASVAIGLLPGMQERLRGKGFVYADADRTRPPGRAARIYDVAVSVFCQTVMVAEELAANRNPERRTRIAAVVGAPGTGKTTTVCRIAERLRGGGLKIGGVVQPALVDGGLRVGYGLRDLATGDERSFVSLAPHAPPGTPRFAFDAAGWAWAADRIQRDRVLLDVLVVDEIGRLEAAGDGHMPALLDRMTGGNARWWLLSVRADVADTVSGLVGGFDVRIDLGGGGDIPTSDEDGIVARMLENDVPEMKEAER